MDGTQDWGTSNGAGEMRTWNWEVYVLVFITQRIIYHDIVNIHT